MAGTSLVRQFVGRRAQLALLEQRYQVAASGNGGIVLVSGESGSGKSRLVYEMCSRLTPLGARCAMGQCLEYAQSPFAPFLAVLSALAADEPAVLASAPALRSTLAHLMPDLDDSATGKVASESDKLHQFNAIVELLRRFGEQRPLVVVIEDIHWADGASLELLQHFAARAGGLRVLIVVTVRTEDMRRNHPLRSLIAKLARQATFSRTDLAPLPQADMHELVFNAADERMQVSAATLGAICAQAEGNPLFAEELLKTVAESGNLAPDRLPGTLREAVVDRFSTLDEHDKAILTHAAVLGRRFKPELLAAIAGVPVADVIKPMKRAIELSLVIEESNGDVRFAFRHELTRAAVYSELLVAEASLLHAKIAAALEASDGGAHEAELAYHWWHARQPERAAIHFERAGDVALELFAHRDALVNYERALQFGTKDGAQRAALQLKLASALHQCGLDERARRAVEEALVYFESVGDRESAAATCLRLAFMRGGYGDIDAALELTRKALELIENDPASRAYFEAHVQMMSLFSEFRWEPGQFEHHMALASRATGDRSDATRVLFLALSATWALCQGRVEEALALTNEAATLALQSGDVRTAARCWAVLGIDGSDAGEPELARDAFAKALELMESRGIGGLTAAWIVNELARARLLTGELNEARDRISQALAEGIELPIFRTYVARTGIPLGLLLEDDSLVRRCAQKGILDFALRSSTPTAIATAGAFAELQVAHGKTADAAALLKRALESLEKHKARPSFGAADECMVAVAEYGNIEDIPTARQFLERTTNSSSARSTRATLSLFDAHAAARTGDPATARLKAQEATEAFRTIGWPLFEAQALEVLGKPSEALEIFRRVGALREIKRLEPIVNPVNRRGRSKDELTAREREICELLVQGKTNKAIAEKLVLSERTVESHVSSILTKVGAASRAELIAKLKS